MNKIFQEYFLDDPVFRLVASYSKIYQQIFWKKFIFKVGSTESIQKILKRYLRRNLHFRKFYYTPGYICGCS